jgi:kanamycin kinase
VGDVWADLAIASWSTVWNYGPGYERLVYDAYGVDPDSGRIAYYRELWDAT